MEKAPGLRTPFEAPAFSEREARREAALSSVAFASIIDRDFVQKVLAKNDVSASDEAMLRILGLAKSLEGKAEEEAWDATDKAAAKILGEEGQETLFLVSRQAKKSKMRM